MVVSTGSKRDPFDDIPLNVLREKYEYDPVSGVITHRGSGQVAGRVGKRHGYLEIHTRWGERLRCIRAHRLAWYLHTGERPAWFIDHINRRRSDNRFANLRDATPKQNRRNCDQVDAAGIRGNPDGSATAFLQIQRTFKTVEEARAWRQAGFAWDETYD